MPKHLPRKLYEFSATELNDMCAKGAQLGKYPIIKTTWNDQPVAIKCYKIENEIADENDPNMWDEYVELTSFRAELAVFNMANNREVNLIKCYGHGSYRGTQFVYHCLVMPFLDNGDLYHYIQNNKCLSWRNRLSMMKGLTNAVTYLHENELVHVDIKSLNLLVTDKLKIRLTDFQATQENNCCIYFPTITWQAPEIYNFLSNFTYASDVYSVTVVLWELAAWKHPFQGKKYSESELFEAVQHEPREPIPADCLPSLARLITWGWKVDPKKRPTIQQVAEVILSIKRPGTPLR